MTEVSNERPGATETFEEWIARDVYKLGKSPHRLKMERIDRLDKEGKCWCDDDHLCRTHAEAFYRELGKVTAENPLPPGGVQALILQVRARFPITVG